MGGKCLWIISFPIKAPTTCAYIYICIIFIFVKKWNTLEIPMKGNYCRYIIIRIRKRDLTSQGAGIIFYWKREIARINFLFFKRQWKWSANYINTTHTLSENKLKIRKKHGDHNFPFSFSAKLVVKNILSILNFLWCLFCLPDLLENQHEF